MLKRLFFITILLAVVCMDAALAKDDIFSCIPRGALVLHNELGSYRSVPTEALKATALEEIGEVAGMMLYLVKLLDKDKKHNLLSEDEQKNIDEWLLRVIDFGYHSYLVEIVIKHGLQTKDWRDQEGNSMLHLFAKGNAKRLREFICEEYCRLGFTLLRVTNREKVPLRMRGYFDKYQQEKECIDRQAHLWSDTYENREESL